MKAYVYITRKLPGETIAEIILFFKVKMWDHEDISVPRALLLEEAKKASALITMLSDRVDEELFPLYGSGM